MAEQRSKYLLVQINTQVRLQKNPTFPSPSSPLASIRTLLIEHALTVLVQQFRKIIS
jgi:hypothetical protein